MIEFETGEPRIPLPPEEPPTRTIVERLPLPPLPFPVARVADVCPTCWYGHPADAECPR
jgi:hypothetical protein